MLRQIHVEHYKSIAEVNLRLNPINVFVGSNSTGKSNFIDSITFLCDCLVHGVDNAVSERHGIDSILQWSPTRPYNLFISIQVEEPDGWGQYSIRIGSKAREPYVIEENGYWINRGEKLKRYSFSRSRDKISFESLSANASKQLERLAANVDEHDLILRSFRLFPLLEGRFFQRLFHYITSFEVYSIYPNTIRAPQRPSRDQRLSATGDNLTSILKSMVASKSQRVKSNYQEIIATMAKIIPHLDRILVRNVSGLLWPIFEISEAKGKHQFNVAQISDGALRMLGLLTAVYQPNPPRVLAIEEPEQNIHPGALALLAEAFKTLEPSIQIFLTTHSPYMIDYFDPNEIFATDFIESRTLIAPISKSQQDAIRARLLSPGEIMASQGFELEN